MLNDFNFSFDEFACGRHGINKNLLDKLLFLHLVDVNFYFTGSRYLNSIRANYKTDYDFFFLLDNDLRHYDIFLNGIGLYRTGNYFNDSQRWRSMGKPPLIDVFCLNKRNFEIYKNANETIQSMPDAPFHTRRERIRLFNELCGSGYIRRIIAGG